MHLVSCRHSTSGRCALMNLATRSMRSRTELMFQVVRERRMGSRLSMVPRDVARIVHRRAVSTRRGRVPREVDLEQAGIDLLGGVEIVDGNRGVITLRIGHGPLLELAVLGPDH